MTGRPAPDDPGRPSPGWAGPVWPVVVGLATGAAVLGPALRPGALFNLDLVVTEEIFVPDSLWGLGPELPRRGPFYALLAGLSKAGGGAGAWKIIAVATVALAFWGIIRRTQPLPLVVRVGAGWVYSLSPFLLTRVGVGHLGLALAMAILPHALPTIACPGRDLRRTFLWAVALSVTGVYGLLLAGPLLLVGLISTSSDRRWRALLLILFGQAWWLLSSVLVIAQGGSVAGGAFFPTSTFGPGGALRVAAGHGFWQPAYQVGVLSGWVVPLGALVLTWLGLVGHPQLPLPWRRPLAFGAVVGLVTALAPVTPVLDDVHSWLTTGTSIFGPLREPQRLLALWVLWVALASAHGAVAVANRLRGSSGVPLAPLWALPGLIALALGAPGLWAVGGQLEPVELPLEWGRTKALVENRPGTVLALPWTEFYDLPVAGDRRVVNPLPYYLGGDVLMAADPKFGDPVSESVDPRLAAADELVETIREGRPVAADLATLGIRWVVLVRAADESTYRSLDSDPDLDPVIEGPTLATYENELWRGDVVGGSDTWPVSRIVAPLRTVDSDAHGRWARPGGRWWLQGVSAISTADDGLAEMPGGAAVLWYWPAVLVLTVDLVVAASVTVCLKRLRSAGLSDDPVDGNALSKG